MKKIFMTAAALLLLIAVTGCGVSTLRNPISVEKYKEVSEENGLTVEIKEGEASTSCNGSGENYSSQFYLFDTVEKCDAAYEYLISKLVTSVTGENISTEKTDTEYKKCIVKSTTIYNAVIQLDNTLVYAYSMAEDKETLVEEYLKALGY
ncbi:MAG: hypothetical protein NC223_09505 [Butyrivibrio sp.]|nr:hypothetical protein [Butyrivibrio sp.]